MHELGPEGGGRVHQVESRGKSISSEWNSKCKVPEAGATAVGRARCGVSKQGGGLSGGCQGSPWTPF